MPLVQLTRLELGGVKSLRGGREHGTKSNGDREKFAIYSGSSVRARTVAALWN